MSYTFRVLFGLHAYLMAGMMIAGMMMLSDAAFATTSYDLSGQVKVTKVSDGDSLRSGKLKIRIFGIDAPELKQQCQDQNGTVWACGLVARQQLENLLDATKLLHCELRDVDRYGRLVMQCFRGTVDIGAAMVQSGHALAYRSFSQLYVAEEQHATSARNGVWRGSFQPPWEWRQQN
jgi:endonuclease YncB( thermonuclease family)